MTVVAAPQVEDDDDECPGEGRCHGPLGWCSTCGDVGHVCDMRLRGERCDAHPVPPEWRDLRRARAEAERLIAEGQRMIREGEKALLDEVGDGEIARRAFDAQREKADAALWPGFR